MIAFKDLYAVITQMVIQDEAISWNRLYNFSMANSILVLAWATIYASSQNTISAKIVLSAICLLGGLSGIAWAELGTRTRKHFDGHFAQALAIEKKTNAWEPEVDDATKPFLGSEAIRSTAAWYSSNPFLLKYTPLGFTALYVVLLVSTWCKP